MIHMQDPIPNWPEALLALPADQDALLKSVNNPSTLTEGRRHWAAAGRDPRRLITCFRHADIEGTEGLQSWEDTRAHWRRQFFRAIDRTYLERYAPFVRLFEEANEYTDDDMANGLKPAEMLRAYTNTRAAVAVWNDEFRGRLVRSPDGGEGRIPDDCRLVIGNVPVGNDIPKSFYELAVSSDNVLGAHPYWRWHRAGGIPFRDPGDWRFHAGRWHFNEQQYGIKPRYAFTEAGPYANAALGWRAAEVLGADEAMLVQSTQAWLHDLATTAAYAEGRIAGVAALFTSGGGEGWKWYELATPQLKLIAAVIREFWHPGQSGPTPVPVPTPLPTPEDPMTPEQTQLVQAALADLNAAQAQLDAAEAKILSVLPPTGPVPLFRVRIIVPVLNVRAGPGASFADVGDVLQQEERDVYEVWPANGWLRIDAVAQRWISGLATYSVRV